MTTNKRQRRREEDTLQQLQRVAQENSNNDPVVAEILLMNLCYNWGKGRNPRTPWIDKPNVVDGVKFWRVGHNASHEFYAGTDGNGKRFRYSVGESCRIDIDGKPLTEDGIPGVDRHMSEVANFHGYNGHF